VTTEGGGESPECVGERDRPPTAYLLQEKLKLISDFRRVGNHSAVRGERRIELELWIEGDSSCRSQYQATGVTLSEEESGSQTSDQQECRRQ
jgi:hypothetical protein